LQADALVGDKAACRVSHNGLVFKGGVLRSLLIEREGLCSQSI
jgi:hypothetical protein